jgi:hypothetical protein
LANVRLSRYDASSREGELTMSTMPDELLPAAADNRKKIAEVEAEKATEYLRKQAAADAEKKALLEQLEKPSGVTDEASGHHH